MRQGTLIGIALLALAIIGWFLLLPSRDDPAPVRTATKEVRAEETKPKPDPKPAEVPADAQPAEGTTRARRAAQMEACRDCHPTLVEGFEKTGMGRSLYATASAEKIEDFSPTKAVVSHGPSGLSYRAYVDDEGRWWQEEVHPPSAFSKRVEALYVIGSGNHTRSYLGEVNGQLIELPLTWYVRKKIWDMSPGYQDNNFRFSRDIGPKCIFCHNDLTAIRKGTISGYAEPLALGISCVRCHGDPTKHIELRAAGQGPAEGEPDLSIVNPKRLSRPLSQEVCEQCHLQGKSRVLLSGNSWDEYTPEKPLHDYMGIYVEKGDAGADFGIASHGYRLKLSACAKDERLQCTTCHDPHRKNTPASYRIACKGCHSMDKKASGKACQNPRGRQHKSDCVKCHMHKGDTSDIPHVNFTDHYIRKRPDELLAQAPPDTESLALIDVYDDRRAADEGEAARLGLAHHDVVENQASDRLDDHSAEATRILEYTLDNNPKDERALRAVGDLYARNKQFPEAADRLARAVAIDGSNAIVWRQLANAYLKMGLTEKAEEAFRKATKLRPDYVEAWVDLGNSTHRLQRFAEAERMYKEADKIDPNLNLIPFNRAINFMAMKQFRRAKGHFSDAIERDPMDLRPYLHLGVLQYETRNAEAAVNLMGRALNINPDHAPALWLRGRALLEVGEIEQARVDLIRFLKLEPRHMMAYINLARVEHNLENYQGGVAIIQRGIKMLGPHPNFDKALQELKKSTNPLYDLPQ